MLYRFASTRMPSLQRPTMRPTPSLYISPIPYLVVVSESYFKSIKPSGASIFIVSYPRLQHRRVSASRGGATTFRILHAESSASPARGQREGQPGQPPGPNSVVKAPRGRLFARHSSMHALKRQSWLVCRLSCHSLPSEPAYWASSCHVASIRFLSACSRVQPPWLVG